MWVGVREDVGVEPSLPPAQQRPVTVREAVGHLPAGEPGTHSPQVLAAWRQCGPGGNPRKTQGHVGSFHSSRLRWDRPSFTHVRAHVHWHPDVPRHLTVEEVALLSSYPAGFAWPGPLTRAAAQIGNSVPPLLMRAVASHVRREVLEP